MPLYLVYRCNELVYIILVLVYCGRSLPLDTTLSDNKIKNGSCVNVIVGDIQAEDGMLYYILTFVIVDFVFVT